jgi:ABC-type uncharacterized transport system involved in gliding motility auxiliary subunit
MKKRYISAFASYAGLVFVVVAILLYGFLGKSFQTWSLIHLGLAVICLIVSLVFRRGKGGSKDQLHEASYPGRDTIYTALYVFFFLGVLVFGGVLVKKYLPVYIDVTEEKVYSLSSHTLKVLNDLSDPVYVKVFSLGGEPPEKLRILLDRYARSSSDFRWNAFDPDTHRTLVEKLGVQEKDTLYFSFEDAESDAKGILLSRNIDEEGITNALTRLVRGKDTIVYVPQSHGEGSLSLDTEAGFSFLRESVSGEGYTVSELDLISVDEIPVKNSVLLILAPQKSYLPGEKEKVQEFIRAGGNVLFLLEPLYVHLLQGLIEPLGIVPGADVIVDKEAFTFKDGVMGVQPLVDTFSGHHSVKDFGKTIILSTASSVRKLGDADQVTEIAFTSETSWAETDLESLYSDTPTAEKTDDDIPGPVSVAAVYENSHEAGDQRIMVIGDTDFVSNIHIRQLFNRDFFLNALNWVAGEEEVVKIRAGTLRRSREVISPAQFTSIFTFAGILIPELILLLGIGVWVYRR